MSRNVLFYLRLASVYEVTILSEEIRYLTFVSDSLQTSTYATLLILDFY